MVVALLVRLHFISYIYCIIQDLTYIVSALVWLEYPLIPTSSILKAMSTLAPPRQVETEVLVAQRYMNMDVIHALCKACPPLRKPSLLVDALRAQKLR